MGWPAWDTLYLCKIPPNQLPSSPPLSPSPKRMTLNYLFSTSFASVWASFNWLIKLQLHSSKGSGIYMITNHSPGGCGLVGGVGVVWGARSNCMLGGRTEWGSTQLVATVVNERSHQPTVHLTIIQACFSLSSRVLLVSNLRRSNWKCTVKRFFKSTVMISDITRESLVNICARRWLIRVQQITYALHLKSIQFCLGSCKACSPSFTSPFL